jgi:hypothetical protein
MSVEELPSIIICNYSLYGFVETFEMIFVERLFSLNFVFYFYIYFMFLIYLFIFYLLELELLGRYLKVILSDLLLCQLIQKVQALFLYKLSFQQEFESNHDLEPLLLPNVKIQHVFLIHEVLVEFEP